MKYEYLKGSEKDFEGAPEWCRFVVLGELFKDLFYMEGMERGLRFKSQLGNVSDIIDLHNSCEIIAERRPITEPVVNQQLTTEWGDDGLPPVGALCRYRAFSDMPWVKCEVLGWHGDDAWLKRTEDGRTFVMGNPELFPIKSPEEVARDEAIEAMINAVRSIDHTTLRVMVEILYDAGYRKQ